MDKVHDAAGAESDSQSCRGLSVRQISGVPKESSTGNYIYTGLQRIGRIKTKHFGKVTRNGKGSHMITDHVLNV